MCCIPGISGWHFHVTAVQDSIIVAHATVPTTLSPEYDAIKMSHRKGFTEQRSGKAHDDHANTSSQMANPGSVSLLVECILKYVQKFDFTWVNERFANEEHGPIIDGVATVYTYHDIMSSKFVNGTSIVMKAGVLEMLKTGTAATLGTTLKMFEAKHCAELLAQDPGLERQRENLVVKRKKLKQALTLVKNLRDCWRKM
jgi:hypothetical protein